eukprot:CAMPEP_0194222376 /NCGR_PEP_ID=MMETSP0156-20130528/32797_1 /TAXON_ID=33649 /ORGANISM="Thalassionema nitzschioides, Strain L26-B" /LENGTH=333 /DNA_ID=CAMNT_0038953141 /DNA_START=110 /DNA_END=1111 /DNA_ORIENTATION=-
MKGLDKKEQETLSDKMVDKCSIQNAITDSPLFSKIFEDGLTERFQVWGGCEPLPNPGMMCQWHPYRIKVPSWIPKQTPKICLSSKTSHGFMNSIIRTTGRWADCPTLINLYNKNRKSEESLYMEIGTQFGPCIFDILISTNATVVAFENDITNLYQLTSTLLTLPDEVRSRLALFYNVDFTLPTDFNKGDGLNAEDTEDEETTVGLLETFLNSVSTENNEPEKEENEIMTTTLGHLFHEDYLNPKSPYPDLDIAVLKIDAPGMSCDIVEGAKKILPNAQAIVKIYEIDGKPSSNNTEGKKPCGLAEWKNRISNLGSYDIMKLAVHAVALPKRD